MRTLYEVHLNCNAFLVTGTCGRPGEHFFRSKYVGIVAYCEKHTHPSPNVEGHHEISREEAEAEFMVQEILER